MFHALAHTVSDLLIGSKRNMAWHQAYRALEHGNARDARLNSKAMQGFPHEIREFAVTFIDLQKERHQADYSCETWYAKENTLAAIDRAADAIDQLLRANVEDRRRFVTHMLFGWRSS